jgi:hypothetical protein
MQIKGFHSVNQHDESQCQTCRQREYLSFLLACWDETFSATNALSERFGLDKLRWDYSTEEALLLFSQSGVTKIKATIQAVGSTQDGSWEWSWANPALPDISKWRMPELRGLGEQKCWARLTTPFLKWEGHPTPPLAEDELVGWECSSIANHVLGGLGVFRATYPGGILWLVITGCEYLEPAPSDSFWARVFAKGKQ